MTQGIKNSFFHRDLEPEEVMLGETEATHCVRVLRMKKGDELVLVDGAGNSALAVLEDDRVKQCLLRVVSRTFHRPFRDYCIHVAVAPTKQSDRMEWFIEKATEAGVDEITFIQTRNSERGRVNMDRFEKIAVSAMKQSKQFYLPRINNLVQLNELVGKKANEINLTKLIAHCETGAEFSLRKVVDGSQSRNYFILIGPEGDFDPEEVDLALKSGFSRVSLGASTLRTETAALYACLALKALLT